MATQTVHTGNYGSYLYIDYSFSTNTTLRTWTCTASLKLQMGPGYNFDAWVSSCGNSATLRKDGGSGYTHGNTYTLVGPTQVGSGSYDAQGNAPTVSISWAWNVNSSWGGYVCPHGTISVTGPSIGPAGTVPSDLSVSNLSSTWNSVTGTFAVGDWGGLPAADMYARVFGLTGSARRENQFSGQSTVTTTVTNSSAAVDGGITIKGCGLYKVDCYASNVMGGASSTAAQIYTPPAPAQITYTDPGGLGTKNYVVTFTGVVANNNTTYDTADLERTVRYKVDDDPWVYYESSEVKTIDATTVMTIPVPAGSTAIIDGWMNYKGLSSESVSVMIVNTNEPVHFYGGVSERDPVTGEWSDPEAKEVVKFYGPLNGETVKVVKIYGSHEGVARKVFEDE